jgi:hypothetical protein
MPFRGKETKGKWGRPEACPDWIPEMLPEEK